METMNTTTTTNKREGDEKDFEEEEDKKRVKKDELEEDELETQETHPWSANEEILEEEVYVQDLGKVSDDVKVVEAEKKSWNRKPLARPIDGQTDSILGHRLHHRPAARDARPGETVEGPGGDFANVWRDRRRPLGARARARFQPVFLLRGAGNFHGATHSGVFDVFEFANDGAPKVVEFGEAFRAGRAFDFR
jgi:hypothetical protein